MQNDENMSATEVAAIERGQQAWGRLKSGAAWEDWLLVGQALEIGRTECRARLGIRPGDNRNLGRGFNESYSKWLEANKFADIDKGVRSRLQECMENRAKIEAWRAALTDTDRLKLNHPQTVLTRWRASTQVKEAPSRPSPQAALKDKVVEYEEEIARLKRNGGELFNLQKDTPKDMARVMFDGLTESRFISFLTECAQLHKLRQEQFKAMKGEAKDKAKALSRRGGEAQIEPDKKARLEGIMNARLRKPKRRSAEDFEADKRAKRNPAG
jgi:hypothetical protein